MKRFMQRTASFALALFVLLGSVSCTKTPTPEEPVSGTRLTVTEVPAVYTPEMLTSYAERVTALCADAVFYVEGLVLNETQRQKLTATLRDELLPRLSEIPVYPEETDAVLSALEQTVHADVSDGGLLPLRFYQSCLSVVGSTRAGKLGYLAASMWLTSREETCRARFDKYGYSWYLEDAERYASLRERLSNELGEDGFCNAAEMLTFAASSLVGGVLAEEQETAYGLSSEELTAILQKQAARFGELCPTESQWTLVGDLLTELVPERRGTPMEAEADALARVGYFARAAAVMPSVIDLYGAFVSHMTPQDAETILWSEDETARTVAVCRVLSLCDGELTAFLRAAETHAATADEEEQKALKQTGVWDDCQAFLLTCGTADAETLRAAVASCAAAQTIESAQTLGRTLRAYLATQAPYLFYTLQSLGKETSHAQSNATV